MAEELKITDNSTDKEKTSCESGTVKRLRDNFHAASKNWRKQMNTLRCKLVNDRNVETLEPKNALHDSLNPNHRTLMIV